MTVARGQTKIRSGRDGRSRAGAASLPRRVGLAAGLLALAATSVAAPGGAAAKPAQPQKVIRYQGQDHRVPASWPVYRLKQRPSLCVRLDRAAVYLGTPGPAQRCPAQAAGRRRAIVIGERGGAAASRGGGEAAAGVATARASAAGTFFRGLGFDACAAPSGAAMRAWRGATSYRAVGVYIGGINRACAQPNLTTAWVDNQLRAGWHLIPTFVGLQAPNSSCTSCARFGTQQPGAKGATAANRAVSAARAIGIGRGNPIYYDLEHYARTTAASKAVRTFLAAWTKRLHALGYVSGVYSSASSGITELVRAAGTSFLQPDEIWIANWNGKATDRDPYVPNGMWDGHRIRQYRGGHNETHGGVTINIDNNYAAGATVGLGGPSPDDPRGRFQSVRSPRPGRIAVSGWAFDPNFPTDPVSIVAWVGGRAGSAGAKRRPLGPAALPRPDVESAHPEAGPDHGFDTAFSTTKAGVQRICLYAANLGPGSNRLLGCRAVKIGPAIALSRISAGARRLGVTVRCRRPAGTRCRGRIQLHARLRLSRRPGAKPVGIYLARRRFQLAGGGEQRHFVLDLNRRALPALRLGRAKARLGVAVGGTRLGRAVIVGRR